MKTATTKALLGSIGATVLTLCLASAGWSMPGGGPDRDPARAIEHMTEKLELSEEQATAIDGLLAANRNAAGSDRQRMQTLRNELKAQRENFDAARAQKIADEIGSVTARMAFRAAELNAGVYQVLTPEQRTKMEQMMAKREQRRMQMRQGKHGKHGKNTEE